MMEFNTMINKLLKKHPETRRRKLRIQPLHHALLLTGPLSHSLQAYALMLWCPSTKNAA